MEPAGQDHDAGEVARFGFRCPGQNRIGSGFEPGFVLFVAVLGSLRRDEEPTLHQATYASTGVRVPVGDATGRQRDLVTTQQITVGVVELKPGVEEAS